MDSYTALSLATTITKSSITPVWVTAVEVLSSVAGLAAVCWGIMAFLFRRWKKKQKEQQVAEQAAEKDLITNVVKELVGPEVGREVDDLLKTDIRQAIKDQVQENFASALDEITNQITKQNKTLEWITHELQENSGLSLRDAVNRTDRALVIMTNGMTELKDHVNELKEGQSAINSTLIARKDGEKRLDDRVDQLQRALITHIDTQK